MKSSHFMLERNALIRVCIFWKRLTIFTGEDEMEEIFKIIKSFHAIGGLTYI